MEEEVQADGDTNLNLRISDDDGGGHSGDEESGSVDAGAGESWEMNRMKRVASLNAAFDGTQRSVYRCPVCGKIYTYLVPFRKHQLQHEMRSLPRESRKGDETQRYECSDCQMTFTRKEKLRAHARLHEMSSFFRPGLHQCDRCGKTLTSARTWAAHMKLHKQQLFWCLSCSKGFPDEVSLDRHLQGHNRKRHTCKICRKSFVMVAELVRHYKSHAATRVYQCTLCSKSFSFIGNLISHRKQHFRVFPRGEGRASRRLSQIRFRKRKGRWRGKQGRKAPEPLGAGNVDSDGSDCGEPTHQLKPSNQMDESGSERVAPAAGQELQEREPGGAQVHRLHKYWEWECCVCDMGFDEVEQLHLHYVKHATGELPIPQDCV